MVGDSRKQASQIAKNLVEDRTDCITAMRALLACWRCDQTLLTPEDFLTLKGIDSETEDLPVGLVRELWHPDALQEKDNEILRSERRYGDSIRSICHRLLEKLDHER